MNPLISFPLFNYRLLFDWLLPVGCLCGAAGLMIQMRKATNAQEKLMAIIQAAALVALMANFDTAVQDVKGIVHTIVHDGLKAAPEQTIQKFATKMLDLDKESGGSSFWRQITKTAEVIFHALLVALILFAALVAFALNSLAYLAQEMALEFGIAFAPLMIGFLFLAPTRAIGVQFLLYMLALALFPLGWGAASLVSDQLIDLATTHQFVGTPDTGQSLAFAFRTLLASLILAIWIVLSTLVAPFAMIKLVTTGVHLSSEPIKQLAIAALRR